MIEVLTQFPVAVRSPDHLHPWGTKNDNSANPRFNQALAELFGASLSVLDIGCSGGGMVKSFVDQGVFAAGIEGSDYSKERRRAEWATIPDHLFTADAAKPFQVKRDGVRCRFAAITAWEFLEHIDRHDLVAVSDNIHRHLAPDGLVFGSVSHVGDAPEGVELHQTVEPFSWWETVLWSLGWRIMPGLTERMDAAGAWVRAEPNSSCFVLRPR